MKRHIFFILILLVLFGCNSADKNNQSTGNNDAEIGKLQQLINNSSAGDTIDLSGITADDTTVVINKSLTLKNGELSGITLDIAAENVTLQNVESVKKVTNSHNNLTIINTNISELLLENNQTRSTANSVQANLIGCRIKSLTAESATNIAIANFNANIDSPDIKGNVICPENVAAEINMTNNFTELENSDLYNYYDENEPAGKDVVYVTKEGWPQYAVNYVLALYPEAGDWSVSADTESGKKINYYFESESKAKDVFTKTGWGDIEKARICMVFAPENDKENYSDYKAYLEKITQLSGAKHEFYYLNASNNDCAVTFRKDDDNSEDNKDYYDKLYYEAADWREAVADYMKAFNCSEDDAKKQLFGTTDDTQIEADFGGEGSVTAIYASDWNETDEARWIEAVVKAKCAQNSMKRDNLFRSDSFIWNTADDALMINVDESWFYENEKFEENALYYQISFFSAVKKKS